MWAGSRGHPVQLEPPTSGLAEEEAGEEGYKNPSQKSF